MDLLFGGGEGVNGSSTFIRVAIRIDLLNNIALISRVSTAILLYGNKGLDMAINKRIFDEVHKFIISSHRFE